MEKKYHSGELEIQEKFGEKVAAERVGRIISNTIIPGAVPFIENQNLAILCSLDNDNNVWISVLVGAQGFITVPELHLLSITNKNLISSKSDIFFNNIEKNSNVGAIIIELSSRRRYRINGTVNQDDTTIHLNIDEAYPNCPKYIQSRIPSGSNLNTSLSPKFNLGETLEQHHLDWITQADTLFVGTQGNNQKLDASHRGGNTGFIEIIDNNTLKIPDYVGNMMYNTLGNILQTKKAGLLFIDFENKRTLQLTGKAELLFDQHTELDTQKTTGTGRYWLFSTIKWIQTDNHHPMDWEYLDASPFNPEFV